MVKAIEGRIIICLIMADKSISDEVLITRIKERYHKDYSKSTFVRDQYADARTMCEKHYRWITVAGDILTPTDDGMEAYQTLERARYLRFDWVQKFWRVSNSPNIEVRGESVILPDFTPRATTW